MKKAASVRSKPSTAQKNKETCGAAVSFPVAKNKKAAGEGANPSSEKRKKDACGDASETEMVKYSPGDAEFKERGPKPITVKVHEAKKRVETKGLQL